MPLISDLLLNLLLQPLFRKTHVVSHLKADNQVPSYLQKLRETCGLKIYYQHFDLNQGRLSEKV